MQDVRSVTGNAMGDGLRSVPRRDNNLDVRLQGPQELSQNISNTIQNPNNLVPSNLGPINPGIDRPRFDPRNLPPGFAPPVHGPSVFNVHPPSGSNPVNYDQILALMNEVIQQNITLTQQLAQNQGPQREFHIMPDFSTAIESFDEGKVPKSILIQIVKCQVLRVVSS